MKRYPTPETYEAVALTLAFCGQSESSIGDMLPSGTWRELHEQGYLRTGQDFTGESTTVATPSGVERLHELIDIPVNAR